METAGRAALQQNVEATSQTPQEGGSETTEQAPSEVDEVVASGPSEPVPPPPPQTPNTVGALPPSSPAPEVPDEPAAEVVDETDQGGRETSSRADGEGDEAYPDPSAPVSSSASREGPATAEDPPLAQKEEEPPTDGTIAEILPRSCLRLPKCRT